MKIIKQSWLVILVASFFSAYAQTNTILKSGEPIKNSNKEGYMALPFLSGSISGAIDINNTGTDDIFLQSSKTGQLFLYHFSQLHKSGIPVYKEPVEPQHPSEVNGNVITDKAVVFKNTKNEVYGFFGKNNYIKVSVFDKDNYKFQYTNRINVKGLPSPFTNYGVLQLNNGKYFLLFAVRETGVFSAPKSDPNHYGYNVEGFWTFPLARFGIYGAVVDNLSTTEVTPDKLTDLNQAFFSLDGFVNYKKGNREWLLVGCRTGLIYGYEIENNNGEVSLKPKKHLVDKSGIIHKNPTINASLALVKYQNSTGIITVGEGGIYFYKDLNKQDSNNNLVFDSPKHVFQENTFLMAGSLPVQNVVDWDGDGMLDIISGNSMGFICFYKNRGDNINPKFSDPELLKVGNDIIQVQAGYRGSVQGPPESRWGYVCPTVFDWNGDGLPDLVTGDINANYMIYLNTGTKTSPKLESPKVLSCDGMDIIGTWRVKPGVAKVGGNLWFINQDRDDDLHLYYALDAYNLEDKGKLKLKGNLPIRASYHDYQGKIGRGKYEIVDWNGDGKVDLLIGTYLNHAFPDKINGLPFNMPKRGGKKEAHVLFMRNIGTNESPVFDFPQPLKFKGKHIELGIHACSPSATTLGGNGKLNLVVGEENGKFMFYKREDLSW